MGPTMARFGSPCQFCRLRERLAFTFYLPAFWEEKRICSSLSSATPRVSRRWCHLITLKKKKKKKAHEGEKKGSLALLPWWLSRLFRKAKNTFGKGRALEEYPTHFKKITSYAFPPIFVLFCFWRQGVFV